MKRSWREADRRFDLQGAPVDTTIGSTRARERWFALIASVSGDGRLIRVRHRSFDEAVILVAETRFRELERRAAGGADAAGPASGAQRTRSPPFW